MRNGSPRTDLPKVHKAVHECTCITVSCDGEGNGTCPLCVENGACDNGDGGMCTMCACACKKSVICGGQQKALLAGAKAKAKSLLEKAAAAGAPLGGAALVPGMQGFADLLSQTIASVGQAEKRELAKALSRSDMNALMVAPAPSVLQAVQALGTASLQKRLLLPGASEVDLTCDDFDNRLGGGDARLPVRYPQKRQRQGAPLTSKEPSLFAQQSGGSSSREGQSCPICGETFERSAPADLQEHVEACLVASEAENKAPQQYPVMPPDLSATVPVSALRPAYPPEWKKAAAAAAAASSGSSDSPAAYYGAYPPAASAPPLVPARNDMAWVRGVKRRAAALNCELPKSLLTALRADAALEAQSQRMIGLQNEYPKPEDLDKDLMLELLDEAADYFHVSP